LGGLARCAFSQKWSTIPRWLRNGVGIFNPTNGVLSAMSFVVMAVLGSAIAVSAVLVLYTLVRRWL
jgi:hypothetical protein